MKKLCLVFSVFVFCVIVSGYTLKGGITYTVEQARKEAFANVEYTLPKEIIDANLEDPNYEENKKAQRVGAVEFGDRQVLYYTNGEYCVVYKKNRYYEYYYKKDGRLEHVGKRTKLKYPTKSYKYNTKRKLEYVILYVQKGETYVFDVNGRLEGYWRNNKGYDINGNLINATE